jgi:hypothetical protein
MKRFGEVILPMTKGVTVAGKLKEASAVEYGPLMDRKYSDEQDRDESGRWVTGTAHLEATFHTTDETFGATGVKVKAGQPSAFQVNHYVGRGPESKVRAAEIAAGFPKSAGVRTHTLLAGGSTLDPIHGVGVYVSLTPDKTTGAINETGARRYGQIVKGFEKQGIPVVAHPSFHPRGLPDAFFRNQYQTRGEFEAALVKHVAGDSR